jgi:hypothetical protein
MEEAVTLSRSWLLLTGPACIVGIGLIVVSVLFLLRTIRVPEFARLPLVAEQGVELQEAGWLIGNVDLQDTGPLMFVIDKPRFSNVQASAFKPFALSISLEDAAGRTLKADPVLVPVTVQGIGRMRVDVASLASIEPGRYRLRVGGLASDVGSKDSFLVITRPIAKWKMVAAILGIIVSSALALGGLIASVATFVKFQSG